MDYIMCGRFALTSIPRVLLEVFGLLERRVRPNFNISPGQYAPIIHMEPENNSPVLDALHWGLLPFWAKDKKAAFRTFNARLETIDEKPTFRGAFRHRRCLVPAAGFYEWKKEDAAGKKKMPYYFSPRESGSPLVFAGLWEEWTQNDEYIRSFSIITQPADDGMQAFHDRMPLMLSEESWQAWVNPELQRKDEVMAAITPLGSDYLGNRQISPADNEQFITEH